MARYIDADALKADILKKYKQNWEVPCSYEDRIIQRVVTDLRVLIEKNTPADVAPKSEGEWVFEAHYFYDDYGDLCIYATAKCSECKKAYTNPHSTVASMRVSRPENLSEYDDWNVDVEPFLNEILEMARARKDLSKYCPNCGAHMRKEDEGK